MNWSWLLPEPVSSFGSEIDSIYYLILVITAAIFVIVEVALVVFLFKYRHREGRRAEYSHGHTTLEVVWTVVPFILVMVIAWMSMQVWLEAKIANEDHVPAGALPLRVTAKQFEWNVTYPGPDEKLDTADDFVKRNQLHLPVNRAVRIDLTSEDVIHSFFLPDMRVKQDAVPGMVIGVWVEPTKAGEYTLGCAELCGLGHYRMKGSVTVHEAEAFRTWVSEEGAQPPAVETPAPADTAGTDVDAASASPAPQDHDHTQKPATEEEEQA
ncbi:MAG TPA: cytochrome c oxidase subunit II [Gemmatimonadota bacterium]|nr:cytochrome c oxidase subunit II [Gemmatimonadota bacterium]